MLFMRLVYDYKEVTYVWQLIFAFGLSPTAW